MSAASIHIVERSEKLYVAVQTRVDRPLDLKHLLSIVTMQRLLSYVQVHIDADGSPSNVHHVGPQKMWESYIYLDSSF